MKSRPSFAVLVALVLACSVPALALAAQAPAGGGAAPAQSSPAKPEQVVKKHGKRAKHTKAAKAATATPEAKPAAGK